MHIIVESGDRQENLWVRTVGGTESQPRKFASAGELSEPSSEKRHFNFSESRHNYLEITT